MENLIFWLSYKKDQLFSIAISAYNITSLSKAIYAKKSNVIHFMLPPTCDGAPENLAGFFARLRGAKFILNAIKTQNNHQNTLIVGVGNILNLTFPPLKYALASIETGDSLFYPKICLYVLAGPLKF